MNKQAEIIGVSHISWWKRLWWKLRGDVFIPDIIVMTRVDRQDKIIAADYELVSFDESGFTLNHIHDQPIDVLYVQERKATNAYDKGVSPTSQ